jgi:sRNA-binding protein
MRMDVLTKAGKKWRNAENAVEEAVVRLKLIAEKHGTNAAKAIAHARQELEEAEDDERKAKREHRRLKAEKGG